MGTLNLTKSKFLIIGPVVLGAAIVAIIVFKIPVGNLLLFGLFLASFLLHVFMMNGHGDHTREGKDGTEQTGRSCH